MLRLLLRLCDAARHRARRRTWSPDQATGRRGEDLAHRFLQEQGFQIAARNYRARSGAGEIDLVAWEGATLVFVEVKSRSSGEFGAPDRAVDQDKQATLVRAAREYVRRAHVEWENVRFDTVSVVFGERPEIAHTRDAFAAARL